MNVHKLQQTVAQDKLLRDQLLARFGDALADDEQALIDTLDGVSDFDGQALAVLRSAEDDEMLVTGIKERIDQLRSRAERLTARAAAKREAVLFAMIETGRKKIEAPDCTVSVRATPASVVITDETAIPDDYLKPQPPKVDKAAIRDALKQGASIPGAMLSNGGQSLGIRRN